MILYDNNAYREKFMEIVYGILSGDETNDRANQIIDAFDMAPVVEAEPLLPNDPLTLDELLKMDGKKVWVRMLNVNNRISPFTATVSTELNIVFFELLDDSLGGQIPLTSYLYGEYWLAYRHKPEEESC